MYITVEDALKLEIFKYFKIMAGKSGLKNKIKKVGILDHETDSIIKKNFVKGEFVLSTLVNIKDNMNKLYGIVEKLISVGASGFAIKNIYLDSIPEEVACLANENSFPIFIYGKVFFEDIITEVMYTINRKEENKIFALKINNLLREGLNVKKELVVNTAYEINEFFLQKNAAVFIHKKSRDNLFKFKIPITDKYSALFPYQEGYLFISTFEDISKSEFKKTLLSRIYQLELKINNYYIGISNIHNRLTDLVAAIQESLFAYKYAKVYKQDIVFFNSIGMNMFLLPLKYNYWLNKYYHELIMPIINYDRKNKTELLKTAYQYVENDGNIKKTAQDLMQHNNTIRYRIKKIEEILNEEGQVEHFYEELAILIRMYKLINS